ncbi:MAG: exo-beta-N-acetylmuramidase NamZ family protein [Vulcanimicrobiaceae bacterium]
MKRRDFVVTSSAAAALLGTGKSATAALPQPEIVLGDEVFLRETWRELEGRTVGIVTNQTGATSQLESIVDAVRRNPQIQLKALFAPEHGLRGDRPAGSYVAAYVDDVTHLPVYSLYGPTRRPSEAMLSGIDVLVFDIQDIGARDYTFASTMAYVMEAAAQYGKEFWVLDRPNPIGGTIVEGPVLEPQYKSFIGLYPIALRHGMTIGELARMFNDAFGIKAKLRVVPMHGWRRSMVWPDTGVSWVITSPNIPIWPTTFFYLSTGPASTAGINNGTGTAKPFAYAGAVQMSAYRYAQILNASQLPGVHFRPASWSSFTHPEITVNGVELVMYDPRTFLSVRTAVELIVAARKVAPSIVSFNNEREVHIVWGTDSLRRDVLEGKTGDEITAAWVPSIKNFKSLRAKYLLYS